MSLGNKLIFALVFLVIVPALVATEFFYRQVKTELRENQTTILNNIADLKVLHLESFFQERRNDIKEAQFYKNILTNLPALDRVLQNRPQPAYLAARESLDKQLQPFQAIKKYSDIMLINPDGIVLYSSDLKHRAQRVGLPLFDPGGDILARSRHNISNSEIFLDNRTGADYRMYFCGPLHDYAGSFIGYILIELNLAPIYTLFQDSTGLGASGETVVARKVEDHAVFLNSLRHDPDSILKKTAKIGSPHRIPIQRAVLGESGTGISIDKRGREVLAAWRPLTSLDWGLVVKIDTEEAFAPATRLRMTAYKIFCVFIILGALMIIAISRAASKPIAILQDGAHRLGAGELGFRFPPLEGGEIHQLAQAFNSMADKLADSHATLEERVAQRTADLAESKQVALSAMEDANKQRQMAEDAVARLEKSNIELKKLSSAIEQSPVTVIITDPQGIITYVNPTFSVVSGYSREEALGEHVKMIESGQHPRNFHEEMWTTLLKGESWQGECCNKKKDGTLYWEKIHIAPIFSKDGTIQNFVSVQEDITEQRQIRKSLASMASFAEDNPTPMFRIDEEGNIALANEASHWIFEGDSLSNTLRLPQNLCLNKSNLREVMLDNRTIQKECVIQDRAMLFSIHGDRDTMHANIYGIDVTTQKEAQQHLQKQLDELAGMRRSMLNMMEDLEESNKEAQASTRAKSEFLANMSHEIRTPMNAILGMTYLAMQTPLSPQQQDYLHKIDSAANSLLGIINDILDFSKIEAGKLELESVEFHLDEVLANVANMINQKAEEKGLELILSTPAEIPHILKGDALRLGQILINLANNAVKFTTQGEIIIGVELIKKGTDQATLLFKVADSGIGMTKEQLAGLFQAFRQADTSTTRKYGGTGLGLSISKRLVEMIGGEISVESVPDQGSTFTFTADFEIPPTEQQGNRLIPQGVADLRVLVVDDSSTARDVLQEILESFHCRVQVATSGEEALTSIAQADAKGMPFSLVLMDWQMPPGINGMEAARRIKDNAELSPPPSIIMITGYGHDSKMRLDGANCIDDYLVKPVTPSTMLTAIRHLFNNDSEVIETANVHVAANPEQLRHLQGAKVLVAEDNEINQQVARELLETVGLVVELANNGKEAVAAVGKSAYDLLFMDIQMQEMDGYAATREIRKGEQRQAKESTPQAGSILPIIAMTAHAMTGDREKCLDAGMNDHISKPIEPAILYATLVKWIKPDFAAQQKAAPLPGAPTPSADSAESQLPESLPGIDLQDGLARVMGNTKLYCKLLQDFLKNQAHVPEEIDQALRDNDLDQAKRLAHTIKGIAGTLGARTLQEVTAALEVAINDNMPDRMSTQLAVMEDELALVISSIKLLPAEKKRGAGSAEPVDPEQLKVRLSGLKLLLENNDTEALEVLEELKNTLQDSPLKKTIVEIEMAMQHYDFDSALQSLEKLLPPNQQKT